MKTNLSITINGKIDRNALPDPGMAGLLDNAYAAPRNKMESDKFSLQKFTDHEAVFDFFM